MSELNSLLEKNQTWAKSQDSKLFEGMAKGQSPKTLWIGCSDSRVPESVMSSAAKSGLSDPTQEKSYHSQNTQSHNPRSIHNQTQN